MKPKVLFLCTGDSCRCQMAEGWARHCLSDQIEPYAAAIDAYGMNPIAGRVMLELGVDISGQQSTLVDSLADVPFDLVVTLCGNAAENCPTFPGKARIIHAQFDDPPNLAHVATTEEEVLGHYRRVRDEIRQFVEHELVKHLAHRHLVL